MGEILNQVESHPPLRRTPLFALKYPGYPICQLIMLLQVRCAWTLPAQRLMLLKRNAADDHASLAYLVIHCAQQAAIQSSGSWHGRVTRRYQGHVSIRLYITLATCPFVRGGPSRTIRAHVDDKLMPSSPSAALWIGAQSQSIAG
jgi:hypothetical protein